MYLEILRGDISARQLLMGICMLVHLWDIERGMRVSSELIFDRLAEKYNVDTRDLVFTMRRLTAPDQTKEYYKIHSNI